MKTTVRNSAILLEFVKDWLDGISNNKARWLISQKCISVNETPIAQFNHIVNPGDQIEYIKGQTQQLPDDCPFPILYMDDLYIAINKPAGILTYGKKGEEGTSVYKILGNYLKQKFKTKQDLFVVHRLDREVSGIILFAKNEKGQQWIKDNWSQTRKMYYALVEGYPENENGTCQSYLVEGEDQKVFSGSESEGKLAITHYRVVKKVGAFTLLNVEIETGRKNQIRIHLSEMGCPIVGDRKYGADAKFKRQIRLQAYYFSFPHQKSGEIINLEIPMKANFLRVQNANEVY